MASVGTIKYKSGNSWIDILHPVGSFYFSTVSTSPATLFGGTWVQVTASLLGAVGTNGTISITNADYSGHFSIYTDQVPNHAHYLDTNGNYHFIGMKVVPGTNGKLTGAYGTGSVQYIYAVRSGNYGDLYDATTTGPTNTLGTDYLPRTFGCYIWYRTA